MISRYSVAMPTGIARSLAAHLARRDGQEDCAFVLWRRATGVNRVTAVVADVVLPREGERIVHGTVDFTSEYFLRAAARGAEIGCGVGLIHSHPIGKGWQELNRIDYAAEAAFAGQAEALTGFPLVGLTFGVKDGGFAARVWQRTGPRLYAPCSAETVRVVGDQFRIAHNPNLCQPPPSDLPTQVRTVSAWGQATQDVLAQLNVGVAGVGSVGMQIVEALARTGIGHLTLIDFDIVKIKNLDRLLHATRADADRGRKKIDLAAEAARRAATHPHFRTTLIDGSVVEPEGFAAAADCDVMFACVDRPWGRQVLNHLAYTHLVPVIDGGISVDARGGRLRGAEWRAHVAAPGRACLACLRQYDPADVATERDGLLDDPTYIKGMPADHPARHGENVFIFSISAAAAQLNQFLAMVAAPSGIADTGAHLHHLTTGTIDRRTEGCHTSCYYSGVLYLLGDAAPNVTGRHPAADNMRSTG